MKLDGKVAIVTGAGGGIGKSTALVFLREGAKVALADIKLTGVEEVMRGKEDSAIGVETDVAKKSDVEELVELTLEKWGQIDILVNCAGILALTPIDDVTDEEWDRILNVNLKGTFECCRAVLGHMKERKYGKIINVGSIAGKIGGLVSNIAYSVSKAGVHTLTKVFAKAGAPYGINVNCIAPGPIETAMADMYTPEQEDLLINSIPFHRFGEPKDVAVGALFLASDDAKFITGEILDINGGMLMD